MRKPIVADQGDFERWLIDEVSAQARIVRLIKEGKSRQTGAGADMVQWHFTALMVVLCRYTDRDPDLLRKVATDRKALLEVIRNGPSLMEECERRAEETYQRFEGMYQQSGNGET